jgi:hypothetical protein
MNTPSWWAFALLALAVFRAYRLIAEDTILDRPRKWLLRGPLDTWEKEGDDPGDDYRLDLGIFITCVWCLGWWLSLGVFLLWVWFPTETLFVATPFALSAVVALVAKNLDREE